MWVQIKWWDCWPGKMHFLGKCLLSSTQLPWIIPFYNLAIYQRNCWYHSWWRKNKQHWIVRFWYSLKKPSTGGSWGQLVCLPSSGSICHNKHWTLRSGQFRKKPKIFDSMFIEWISFGSRHIRHCRRFGNFYWILFNVFIAHNFLYLLKLNCIWSFANSFVSKEDRIGQNQEFVGRGMIRHQI